MIIWLKHIINQFLADEHLFIADVGNDACNIVFGLYFDE